MKRLCIGFILLALLPASQLQAQAPSKQDLLRSIRETRSAEEAQMRAREQAFLQEQGQQQQRMAAAVRERDQLQASADALDAQFQQQSEALAAVKAELNERSGNLGELFGVVRQGAGDTRSQWQDSLLNSRFPERLKELDALAQSQRIPQVEQLEQFWYRLQQDMTASGEISRYDAAVVDRHGQTRQQAVIGVGPFVALSEQQYLNYQPDSQQLLLLERQPQGTSLIGDFAAPHEGLADLWIDPSRGNVLDQLQRKPQLLERVTQGGIVGYVIIVLGVLGILLALARLFWLQGVQRRVDRQTADLDHLQDNNPLGRVLSVIGNNPRLEELDTLELKLDEAILKETPALERWQGLIKLLAAVAPLLGLLGTVTGMIATFQAITQYGTGDPKLMADGISQALVTTVLGLIAAIPLLFMHSLVAARSKALIQLLEQQSAGLIALHLGGGDKPRD
ncbi:MAG: MotA/TolQ/ExbB proton channel family protein [Halopseudomonas sp.]|uniref:MotA/TolQ/ExbB proton channel family protein n=1 Tax=Halopseudomonas sp. TaxID=2901191 RepID=UPI003001CC7F